MAYIITTIPEVWIGQIDRAASTAKNEAITVRASATAGTFNRTRLLNLRDLLERLLTVIEDVLALPTHMQALIRDQIRDRVDDPAYDVNAEFLAMQSADEDLRDWIESNYPVHTDGGQSTLDINGVHLTFTLTGGELTALQNNIDAFTATITTS